MLTKDDLKQIKELVQPMFDAQSVLFNKKLEAQTGLFDEKLRAQRSAIMLDMRAMLREELQGIKADLQRLKNREDNDVRGLYEDFDKLRSEFKALESRFAKLEKMKSRS